MNIQKEGTLPYNAYEIEVSINKWTFEARLMMVILASQMIW